MIIKVVALQEFLVDNLKTKPINCITQNSLMGNFKLILYLQNYRNSCRLLYSVLSEQSCTDFLTCCSMANNGVINCLCRRFS